MCLLFDGLVKLKRLSRARVDHNHASTVPDTESGVPSLIGQKRVPVKKAYAIDVALAFGDSNGLTSKFNFSARIYRRMIDHERSEYQDRTDQ